MSIKLYHAYKINNEFTTKELIEACHSVAAELESNRNHKIKKLGFEGGGSFRDYLAICKDEYQVDVTFFGVKDYTLFTVFTSNREFRDLTAEMLGGEFYGYWDNVDPDETCTTKEWEQRKEDWLSIINQKEGSYAMLGLSMTLLDGSRCSAELGQAYAAAGKACATPFYGSDKPPGAEYAVWCQDLMEFALVDSLEEAGFVETQYTNQGYDVVKIIKASEFPGYYEFEMDVPFRWDAAKKIGGVNETNQQGGNSGTV